MRVLVTGATGLIGTALVAKLKAEGVEVARLRRSGTARASDVFWDPEKGTIDLVGIEGSDAVVHLAGENIASGRWTAVRKERILRSRANGTRLLAESLVKLRHPPKVLVGASATGYYGDRGGEVLSEDSAAGSGFLPDVCRAWESATSPAAASGIRVVHFRTGIVLSVRGGALAAMLFPFRMGVGGKVGSGTQYMSWITLDDVCRAAIHVIRNESIRGAVNVVAPVPVTNAEFTQALGKAVHRPTIFPLPAFAARLVFGEMADSLLLSGARVSPVRLRDSGFTFNDHEIEPALRKIIDARL